MTAGPNSKPIRPSQRRATTQTPWSRIALDTLFCLARARQDEARCVTVTVGRLQHDIGTTAGVLNGRRDSDPSIAWSSARFLPNFCRQSCLCNPTEASCRPLRCTSLSPARLCAYCAESQRSTSASASGSPRRVNRARARMAAQDNVTSGRHPTRGCRGTGGPPPTRHCSTTVTLSAHSFCTTQVFLAGAHLDV